MLSKSSAKPNADAAAADQMFEPGRQFLFGSIEVILVTRHVGQFLTCDDLMGHGIQVDLNQGHRAGIEPVNPGNSDP